MNVSELVEKAGLKAFNEFTDQEIRGVYISDMVSDIIGIGEGNLLVTLQTHKNLIAAANLVDLCGIIVAQGKRPADDVLKMAGKAAIAVFSTPLNRWQVATKLYEVGLR